MHSAFTQKLIDASGSFDFVAAHFACEQDKFSADNPQGYVNFGSAQNFLSKADISDRLSEITWHIDDAPYRAFSGTPSCRSSIANYLQSFTSTPVNPDNIVVGNGIISVLEALSIALLDPNDYVLLPTPVFPGLVTALSWRARSTVGFIETNSEDDFRITPELVQSSLENARDEGRNVKAVLLCSPGNPIGQVFTPKEIQQFVSLAEEFNIALIVDEIYASSCFEGVEFASSMALESENLFTIGGLSKDFGLAGYSVGWIHTSNQPVLKALKKQAHYFRLPAPVQRATEVILDPDWRTEFIAANRANLTQAYAGTADQLEQMGINFTAARSGLVLWLDLQEHLKTNDEAGQFELYQFLLNEYRVHISPGSGFHFNEHGYFRICFSQNQNTLQEGLERIQRGLQHFRNETTRLYQEA